MASVWKPLLAATLAAGRNTRLLAVGSSILAMKAPMADQTEAVKLSQENISDLLLSSLSTADSCPPRPFKV